MNIVRTPLALFGALLGALLATPIILLGLPFWAVALLTRALCWILEPQVVAWQDVIEFHPTIGWKPKPHLHTHGLADEAFHLTTDSQGWRGRATIAESEILVFGDSFAFGHGVSDRAFFSELIPGLYIKAIGAPGYNMVQELLWMERLSSQLKGKVVVWLIYFGNDLYENLVPDMCGYRMPFVREVNGTGDWQVITHHVKPAKWLLTPDRRNYYEKLAELCSLTLLSHRAYAACEFLIRRGRDICTEAGAKLTVVTIPETSQLTKTGLQWLASLTRHSESFDPDLPDMRIGAICAQLGVPFLALKTHLRPEHYKDRDCHWNEAGHRRVADILSGLYREQVMLDSRAGRGPTSKSDTRRRRSAPH